MAHQFTQLFQNSGPRPNAKNGNGTTNESSHREGENPAARLGRGICSRIEPGRGGNWIMKPMASGHGTSRFPPPSLPTCDIYEYNEHRRATAAVSPL